MIGENIGQGQVLGPFDPAGVPFGRRAHIDDAQAALFQTGGQLMGRNLLQLIHGPATHQPGHDPAGKIAEDQVVSDAMQFGHHAIVILAVIHDQQKFRRGIHHHTHPVGQLFFKSDIDAAGNVEAAEGC